MTKGRVLSGMRPSGKLHLGNFSGALENWKRLQEEYESFFFVADWHALSTDYAKTANLRDYIYQMLVDWLSAGLNPEKCTIFIQSHVPEHAELHILFSMITPIPWLERVPTYKEQQQELKDRDLSTYGFLGYPLLQAADILVYKADFVPVGIDQLPHLELTREVARRFNFLYKEVFPEPQPLLTDFPKIPGTDGRKMSKSYNNAIYLADTREEVWEKLRTMVTDPKRIRRTDPGDPEVCPVFSLHRVYSSQEIIQQVDGGCRTAGIGCIECKKWLNNALTEKLDPIRDKRSQLINNSSMVKGVVESGAKKAREVASSVLEEARAAIGL
ncbi:MAG: tryptophan--tRNA ligase [Nitrospirae bacterium]|nr:tryptophan--tRNA ligase [Nitrospirota bacterium]